tara:strand:- start:66 stop:542 length:477 start_codon:yes stop_codon:yes gene_type:complete
MATKNITLTVEEMEARIAQATRALSRKKFTEKQLKQFIVNGKIPTESKRTKSGYQLFLDEFRKDLSKEQRSKVGQVARDGSAKWREMGDDDKQPYLDLAIKLKEESQEDSSDESTKTPKKKTKKDNKNSDDSDLENSDDDKPVKKNKKSKKKKNKEDE